MDWLDEDKAFKAAYDQINDNLRGLTQSLIGSTAWKVPFKTALDERPYFSVEDLVGPDRNSACGEFYSRWTMEADLTPFIHSQTLARWARLVTRPSSGLST